MNKVWCISEISLHRPEARRWRNRMRLLEPLGEVVVVLPCSMRKPYSSSKSHHIFRTATRGYQEAIITSPFGICPREMERTYPIQSYDVSTTGDWSQEEIELAGSCLKDYVGDLDVVAHVSGGYKEACEAYLPHANYSSPNGRPTSSDSMIRLRNILKKYSKVSENIRKLHALRSIARYQFKTPQADLLVPDDVRIRGRFQQKIFHQEKHVSTLIFDRGLYSLNIKGGEILQDIGINWVEIDFNLETNTVFAPGVVDAYSDIIPMDEVIITRKGELLGVGRALMAGEEMIEAQKGVAVRLRHRVT